MIESRFLEPVPLSAAFSVSDQSHTLRVPDVLPHVPHVETCSELWSLFLGQMSSMYAERECGVTVHLIQISPLRIHYFNLM